MTESLYHKTIVLFLLGVAMLGMIVIQQNDDDLSLYTNSFPGIFWDGSHLNLISEDNTIENQPNNGMPPRLRRLFFQPIPINEASKDLLMTVPGIGPSTAVNILRTREKYGAFRCAEDLLLVHGIGPKKSAKLQNQFSY